MSTVTVSGQLVPVEWNDQDEITRLAVLTSVDEDEVELDGAEVESLVEFVGEDVVVHGTLLNGAWGNRILRVVRVEVLIDDSSEDEELDDFQLELDEADEVYED